MNRWKHEMEVFDLVHQTISEATFEYPGYIAVHYGWMDDANGYNFGTVDGEWGGDYDGQGIALPVTSLEAPVSDIANGIISAVRYLNERREKMMGRTFAQFPEIPIPGFAHPDSGWEDLSWHNDACARLEKELNPGTPYPHFRLWVEYDNPEEREFGAEASKYVLEMVYTDAQECDGTAPVLYEGDDESAMLAEVQRAILTARETK